MGAFARPGHRPVGVAVLPRPSAMEEGKAAAPAPSNGISVIKGVFLELSA